MHLDDFQELLWSFAGHRALTVAGRAGLIAVYARRSCTPDEAASALGLDPLATTKVTRALCALGVLAADGPRYVLATGLRELFGEGGEAFLPFLEHSHQMYERWGENLEPWLRGEAWPNQQRSVEGTQQFAAAMQAMAGSLSTGVAEALDLEGVRRLIDFGGGTGAHAKALCRAVPGLCAVVVDTPEVAALGTAEVAGTALESRVRFHGGDYLAGDAGEGFDLALIANVLHQEPADRAAALVRTAADALAPQGRLAVVDFSIDVAHREQAVGALFAINMRSRGDVYDEPTLRRWMHDAGLADVQRTDLGRHRFLVVGRKPR